MTKLILKVRGADGTITDLLVRESAEALLLVKDDADAQFVTTEALQLVGRKNEAGYLMKAATWNILYVEPTEPSDPDYEAEYDPRLNPEANSFILALDGWSPMTAAFTLWFDTEGYCDGWEGTVPEGLSLEEAGALGLDIQASLQAPKH